MEKILEGFNSLELNVLLRLVKEGRLEAVKHWMKQHAKNAHRFPVRATPLIAAVELNNQPIVRTLLEGLSREDSRSLVNSRRAESLDGPLHIAAASNAIDITRLLLSCGANFQMLNSADERALDRSSDAAVQDLLRSVEQLFLLVANDRAQLRDFLDSVPAENAAALMYARDSRGLTALQLLMADVDAPAFGEIVKFRLDKLKRADWEAPRPLDELLMHFKRVISHMCILDDCSVDKKEPIGDLIKDDVTSILGQSLEFLSANKRLVNGTLSEQPLLIVIEECLEYYGYGKSAFTESERVKKLLDENAPASVSQLLRLCVAAPMRQFMQSVCTDEMLLAAEANDLPTLEKCLAGAPRLRQRDAAGLTPLHHALRHDNTQMARLLLNFGAADGDGEEGEEETLLHWAVRHMDCNQGISARGQPQVSIDVVRMILDSRVGSDSDYVNARSSTNGSMDGSTALHLAVRAMNFCNVQLLLSRGAVYCAEDKIKRWPADLCYERCSHQIYIKKLLDCCQRLFQLACDGDTAMLLKSMQDLPERWRLAVGGAHNLSGLTLERTLAINGFDKAAEEVRLLLASTKGDK